MVIIGTSQNKEDFQSIVFEVNNLTWDEFKTKIIHGEEFINHIGKSSMSWGNTTKRKCHGRVFCVSNNDEWHLKVTYMDSSVNMFFKTDLANIIDCELNKEELLNERKCK